MELDYYLHKFNERVNSQVAERLKAKDFKKWGSFRKMLNLNVTVA